MYFIGDCHGKFADLKKICDSLSPRKCIQLGDMGFGFGLDEQFHACKNLFFLRGNHDNPEVCRRYPNYLGDYGYLDEEGVFFVSGAFSIDQAYRVEGVSWWRDEELSEPQWRRAMDLYMDKRPSIVATHDCPHDAYPFVVSAHVADQRNRTSSALSRMFQIYMPKLWVFAHHHQFKTFAIDRTQFVALGELDIWDSDAKTRVAP
jgi:hypothetical protein